MGSGKWWQRVDEWLRERLPALDAVEIHTGLHYAWVWKFLISWDKNVTVAYYPDYENARFEVTVWQRVR